MIRYTILALAVSFLVVYAWRDWFKALCGLVVMMAIVEHPDIPTSMLGVPGLNPWNVVLLSVTLSWLAHRGSEDLRIDLPKIYAWLLALYVIVILIGFYRGFTDMGGMIEFATRYGASPPSKTELLTDGLINTFKWAVPGFLIFTGARTNERKVWAVSAVIAVTFLLGLQTIRWMPVSLLSDGEQLSDRALRVLDREIGYHRVDLAALMAAGFWASVACRGAVTAKSARTALLIVAAVDVLALALTGGRMGYGTWAALGGFFAFMRSKKYLVIAPMLGVLILAFVPAAQERLTFGFNGEEPPVNEESEEKAEQIEHLVWNGIDFHAVTSGRALAWPYVIDKIGESPWIGHGRYAMQRTGISTNLIDTYGRGESFPHPHNAYLEAILDNGWLGATPMFLFFALVLWSGLKVLRDRSAPYESALGAVTIALIGAQLVASIGSQSFYPKAGTVTMWCAIALLLRVVVERRARTVTAAAPEPAKPSLRRRPSAIRYAARTKP